MVVALKNTGWYWENHTIKLVPWVPVTNTSLPTSLKQHRTHGPIFIYQTRMHSSRIRTAHSSSHLLEGGSVCLSACWDTSPQVWAWRPPQVWAWRPPQVWAWRPLWPDPPTSPLGVGLEMPPPQPDPQLPPRCGPGDPPVSRIFDTRF